MSADQDDWGGATQQFEDLDSDLEEPMLSLQTIDNVTIHIEYNTGSQFWVDEINLPVGTHTVGRHKARDVAIRNGSVSTMHAKLTVGLNAITLEHLSHNARTLIHTSAGTVSLGYKTPFTLQATAGAGSGARAGAGSRRQCTQRFEVGTCGCHISFDEATARTDRPARCPGHPQESQESQESQGSTQPMGRTSPAELASDGVSPTAKMSMSCTSPAESASASPAAEHVAPSRASIATGREGSGPFFVPRSQPSAAKEPDEGTLTMEDEFGDDSSEELDNKANSGTVPISTSAQFSGGTDGCTNGSEGAGRNESSPADKQVAQAAQPAILVAKTTAEEPPSNERRLTKTAAEAETELAADSTAAAAVAGVEVAFPSPAETQGFDDGTVALDADEGSPQQHTENSQQRTAPRDAETQGFDDATPPARLQKEKEEPEAATAEAARLQKEKEAVETAEAEAKVKEQAEAEAARAAEEVRLAKEKHVIHLRLTPHLLHLIPPAALACLSALLRLLRWLRHLTA